MFGKVVAAVSKAVPAPSGGSSTGHIPVPVDVLQKMNSEFGASLEHVRVFLDSSKAMSVGADAFTIGNEVHFAPGACDLRTDAGKALLGHELTHVVQQGKAPSNGLGRATTVESISNSPENP